MNYLELLLYYLLKLNSYLLLNLKNQN